MFKTQFLFLVIPLLLTGSSVADSIRAEWHEVLINVKSKNVNILDSGFVIKRIKIIKTTDSVILFIDHNKNLAPGFVFSRSVFKSKLNDKNISMQLQAIDFSEDTYIYTIDLPEELHSDSSIELHLTHPKKLKDAIYSINIMIPFK